MNESTPSIPASTSEAVERHIAEHGPLLYHYGGAGQLDRLLKIAREGLRPGSETGNATWNEEDFWQTRPGCVYLGTESYVGCQYGSQQLLIVDLRTLEAERLCADEDHLWLYDTSMKPELREHRIGMEGLAHLLPDCFRIERTRRWGDAWQHESLRDEPVEIVRWRAGSAISRPPVTDNGQTMGAWAARNAAVLARPGAVAWSLIEGSIAHEGTIEPARLRLNMPVLLKLVAYERGRMSVQFQRDVMQAAQLLGATPAELDQISREIERTQQVAA